LKLQSEADPYKLYSMIMNKTPNTNVKAGRYLTQLNDMREARYKLVANLRNDPSPAMQEERRSTYDKTQKLYDAYEKAFQDSIGPENTKRHQELKGNYSNVIYPLRDNKIMNQAVNGKLSQNVLGDLSTSPGNEDAVGHALVNHLVKNDPDMVANVLGQRYQANRKNLLEPNQNTTDFLNLHAPINKAVNRIRNLESQRQTLADSLSRAKAEHQTAIEHEKNLADLQAAFDDATENMQSTQKRIAELQKQIPILLAKNRETKQSLQAKTEGEEKLAKLNAELDELHKKNPTLKNIFTTAANYLLNHKLLSLGSGAGGLYLLRKKTSDNPNSLGNLDID